MGKLREVGATKWRSEQEAARLALEQRAESERRVAIGLLESQEQSARDKFSSQCARELFEIAYRAQKWRAKYYDKVRERREQQANSSSSRA